MTSLRVFPWKNSNDAETRKAVVNDLISVIIPAHNAAPYLDECLQSVEDQTWHNLEIILLDDGSTDETDAICRKHAETDRRIRYIHFDDQQGQGARRNYGIENASSAYIAFVDADDVIRRDMLQILMGEMYAYDAQIAVCRLQTAPEFREQKEIRLRILNGEDAVRHFLTDPSFGAFSCNKIFRRDILRHTGEYPTDIYYEDIVFIPQVCANAEKVVCSDVPLYFYRQHPTSVTRSVFSPLKMDQVEAYERLLPVLLEKFPGLENIIYEKAFFAIMGVFNNMQADRYKSETYRRTLLMNAGKYRKRISIMRAANKKRALIFSLALCVPGIYGMTLGLLYRRLHK